MKEDLSSSTNNYKAASVLIPTGCPHIPPQEEAESEKQRCHFSPLKPLPAEKENDKEVTCTIAPILALIHMRNL